MSSQNQIKTVDQLVALDQDFDTLYDWVENSFPSYEEAHDYICGIFEVDAEAMAKEMGCKDAYGILAYLVDRHING